MTNFIDISSVKVPKEIPKINFYKNQNSLEISVPLFEYCNLNCDFCFENHNNKTISKKQILNIPSQIFDSLKEKIKEYQISEIKLRIWGGELFFDELADSMFDIYLEFYNKFLNIIQKNFPNIKIKTTWLSNGVFTKRDRVKKLIKSTGGNFALSYDPVGRFKKAEEIETWKETLNYFEEDIESISITLTKESVNKYINNDPIFLGLSNKIPISLSYYTANPNWEKYIPDDDDIFNFYIWCLEHEKFNVIELELFIKYKIDTERQYLQKICDCKFAYQYQNGQCILDCTKRASYLPGKMFYGKYADMVTEENCTEIKCSLGLLKRGCLTCEHYEHCPMTCWVSIIFDGYKTTVCPIKRLYEHITDDVIQKYLIWRKNKDNVKNRTSL